MSIILIVVLYFIPGLYYVMSRCVLLRVHIESHRVKVAERERGGQRRGYGVFLCSDVAKADAAPVGGRHKKKERDGRRRRPTRAIR